MQAERWQKIEQIFNATLELPTEERTDFVVENCGDDSDLCQEIINLVSVSEKPDDFLSEPIFSLGAQLLDREFENLLNISDFGHYKLKELIGRGGIGAVFIAEDKVLGRKVALKILPAILDEKDERVLRFQQEARLASAISHPNIAHIYEFGSYEGYYSLAMEYIEGKTLRYFLREHKPNLPLTLKIVTQITEALVEAHKVGIIHRDIKPENIMVTGKKEIKVLDFGLARPNQSAFDSDYSDQLFDCNFITTPGLLVGTAAYMSPEQIKSNPLSNSTDIWSLGVLFYEMAVGKHPFLKESNIETLHHVLKEEPADFEVAQKTLPPLVFKIIKKCLEKDSDKRFQSAKDLLKALKEIPAKESFFDRRKKSRPNDLTFVERLRNLFYFDSQN